MYVSIYYERIGGAIDFENGRTVADLIHLLQIHFVRKDSISFLVKNFSTYSKE